MSDEKLPWPGPYDTDRHYELSKEQASALYEGVKMILEIEADGGGLSWDESGADDAEDRGNDYRYGRNKALLEAIAILRKGIGA